MAPHHTTLLGVVCGVWCGAETSSAAEADAIVTGSAENRQRTGTADSQGAGNAGLP